MNYFLHKIIVLHMNKRAAESAPGVEESAKGENGMAH